VADPLDITPPCPVCGGPYTETHHPADDGPECWSYACPAGCWEEGNGGEHTTRLTLRTHPVGAAVLAAIAGVARG
jgi:hypothetical protein